MSELKIIKGEASEIEEQAARQIKDIVCAKPDAAIALAAGRDVKGLYKRLGEMCAAGEVSLKNARILAVTEFSERHDCENFLREQLCAADVSEENCFFPDAAAPEEYDRLIESLGGLDLAVLGIGQDAHIGYNEPATPFDSYTHVQKLTDRTKRQLSERGYTKENMPEYAVTIRLRPFLRWFMVRPLHIYLHHFCKFLRKSPCILIPRRHPDSNSGGNNG